MIQKRCSPKIAQLKELMSQDVIGQDRDFLKVIVHQAVQDVLEAEMDETLGVRKGQRRESRAGYRSGYYGRSLVTRVGDAGDRSRFPDERDAERRSLRAPQTPYRKPFPLLGSAYGPKGLSRGPLIGPFALAATAVSVRQVMGEPSHERLQLGGSQHDT